jgi:hypothetical protein
MALTLTNLDGETRKYMIEEVEADIENNTLYISPRLSEIGVKDYPGLLIEAAGKEADVWLAGELNRSGRLNPTELRRKPKGGFSTVSVPITANETLAEGEFNRFYARGLCRRAIADGITELIVYRAKEVMNARSESIRKIGTSLDPTTVLDDLRTHPGTDTAMGLPPGPNSGLSVKLP